ncbi:sigma 54-interacting transcriptional regulator [Pseudoalteromonas sp. SSDWG2]|uniref:sigma-54 dependent transcriptional regulator n=1 Tax=Pseudoalteromonas sp. SSDWG2 TaxID=3139391 RepID=UPI003BABEF04
MSKKHPHSTHMERNVLVLSFTQDMSLTDKSTSCHTWHFLQADNLETASDIVQRYNCFVAIAVIDPVKQTALLNAVERLSSRYCNLLWLAISADSSTLAGNLSYCFTDYFMDYHHLPIDWQRLDHSLGHLYGMAQMRRLAQKEQQDLKPSSLIFGRSQSMKKLQQDLIKVASTDETLLIGGETGTGKGMCAQYIHSLSQRSKGPFVTVNCGALPPTLVHSELFGHEKGAFTGAAKQYIGKIERANGGTLFLDEIGDLPLEQQINLLHFLEAQTIERVGGNKPIKVDCRVIFATHVNLEHAVRDGLFREDLYYRINIIQLEIPSLRDHKKDIPLLANDFLENFSPTNQCLSFSQQALNKMIDYHWPGNIRELKNRIQRAIIMNDTGEINEADLGIKQTPQPSSSGNHEMPEQELVKHRSDIDSDSLVSAIKDNNYNISAAAKELNISRTTFYRLLKKCNIQL